MLTRVWLGGVSIPLATLAVVGQGGEADVLDLGDGRVLKVLKTPDHPDVVGDAALEAAATARLASLGDRLRRFPSGLPGAVVQPLELATRTRRGGEVVGYAMRRVEGEPLLRLGEPHWRRTAGLDGDAILAVFRHLHVVVDAVHRAGVVIGDFNDTNVLVTGPRTWLIDADSWQYGGWLATMFCERFVDPRLCGPGPTLVRPHDTDSDWFAFAAMLFRSLLLVGPYGGVLAPARGVPHAARPLHGITVFDRDVVYPKAAVPWQSLPGPLADHFRAVFTHQRRGRFPAELLERLTVTPVRTTAPAVTIRGRVRATPVPDIPRPAADVWLDGAMLVRRTAFGTEPIGQVLAGATRIWVGERLGVGLWRAGGYTNAFVFRPDRRGLRDGLALPRIRGALLDVHAVLAAERAWLWWREALAGKETLRCVALDASGHVLGAVDAALDDAGWLASFRGACAVGGALFVPTDAGIVRVEDLAVARTFPDTADLVTAADELHPAPGGLLVRTRDGALRLELT